MTVAESIKITFHKIESAKKFMRLVGERSQTSDKFVVETLMSILTTMKFDGSHMLTRWQVYQIVTSSKVLVLRIVVPTAFFTPLVFICPFESPVRRIQ